MMVGPLKASMEYVVGSGPADPRMPKILSGNPETFRALVHALGHGAKVGHYVCSHAEEDRPTETELVADAEALLRHFCARLPQPFPLDRLAYLIVGHREAAGDQIGPALEARRDRHRFAAHILVLLYDLLTGRRVQLYYAPAHRRALGAWLKDYNRQRGYACPTDPKRSRKHLSQPTQEELNSFAEGLASVTLGSVKDVAELTPKAWTDILRPHLRAGAVQCGPRGEHLVAHIRLPKMRSRTRLRTHPQKGLEVLAAKASKSPTSDAGSGAMPRVFASFLPSRTMRQISVERLVAMEESAAEVLAPVPAGATLGMNRNSPRPSPTISP